MPGCLLVRSAAAAGCVIALAVGPFRITSPLDTGWTRNPRAVAGGIAAAAGGVYAILLWWADRKPVARPRIDRLTAARR